MRKISSSIYERDIFLKKLKKIEEIAQEKGISKIVLMNDTNIRYLTGLELSGAAILDFVNKEHTIIIPFMENWKIKKLFGGYFRVIGVTRYDFGLEEGVEKFIGSINEAVAKFLIESDKIGIDLDLNKSSDSNIKSKVKSVVQINDEMIRVRRTKLPEEIDLIKKAVEITEKALSQTIENLRNGMREKEIYSEHICQLYKSGAEYLAFDPIVAITENASNPHAISGNRELKADDILLIDTGAKFGGYASDMTRTIIPEKGEFKKYIELLEEAYFSSLDALKTGAGAKEIDGIARNILKKYGLEKYFIHSLGHGVGIDVHEAPNIGPTSNEVFMENEVVAIEPGIYFPEKIGFRLENTVIVGKNGAIPLNSLEFVIQR
ncbi:aminopeptidase P family protein [Fervidicoccus fontis]|uniref:Exopeptidase, family M24B n=2 Tax=Fervidicoccus fontis TaxID=683846 RepID=I0A166_FERFK|nr:Xaa-Pro peptidase family protein [Fervidicoccus fontis]AFH42723.1 exopeptidase, family M24B [Fervidicoccus fontis Kam940]MBE9391301.1 aminopeptidase P family protein [Fervidicoccus fontis]HEW64352.1 aminopeptidase P family protein [Fervidicoccus fontis]